jgi:hypothetical protein
LSRVEVKSVIDRAYEIVDRIDYKGGWWFDIGQHSGGSPYLMVRFWAKNAETGAEEAQAGRKFLLSEHMTDSEIIQTAFLAIKTAEEHETREAFKLDGVAVFGPHFDLASLIQEL